MSWNTIYESPGRHALCAGLEVLNPVRFEGIAGPILPFAITNLCQFSVASVTFDPNSGVFLAAKFAESNATYIVDFLSTEGERLKSISGTTDEGIMKLRWDLIDEAGQRRTNNEFNTVLHVNLPDSGRSQTLKGP